MPVHISISVGGISKHMSCAVGACECPSIQVDESRKDWKGFFMQHRIIEDVVYARDVPGSK